MSISITREYLIRTSILVDVHNKRKGMSLLRLLLHLLLLYLQYQVGFFNCLNRKRKAGDSICIYSEFNKYMSPLPHYVTFFTCQCKIDGI